MSKKPIFFDRPVILLLIIMVILDFCMMFFGPRETLDMKLYYTGDQARALLSGFDSFQQRAYFLNELFDLVFICTYTSLFFISLGKIFPQSPKLVGLAFIPGACDLVETTFIIYATKVAGSWEFFDWLGIATFLKWITIIGLILILLVGSRRAYFR